MNDALKDEMEREMRDLFEDFKKEKAARIAAEARLAEVTNDRDRWLAENYNYPHRIDVQDARIKELSSRLGEAEKLLRCAADALHPAVSPVTRRMLEEFLASGVENLGKKSDG